LGFFPERGVDLALDFPGGIPFTSSWAHTDS
jgi:hypothetical protein